MAPSSGALSNVYCNGYDLTTFLQKTNVEGSAGTYDVTTKGNNGSRVFINGLKNAMLTADGFFTGGIAEADQILAAALGVQGCIWNIIWPTDGFGNSGRGVLGVENKFQLVAPVDGAVTIVAGAQSNVGPEKTITLAAKASVAVGSHNGTASDNAALSSAGAAGYLQVFVQVSTTVSVKIQHSVDNSTWADLITFADVTVSPAAQRVLVTGTVNRYTRAVINNDDGTSTVYVAINRK